MPVCMHMKCKASMALAFKMATIFFLPATASPAFTVNHTAFIFKTDVHLSWGKDN